ncbi:MAG TPA: AAA family ATPase, partial [Motilibacteraceae bacterium]|nr:AAA family ATPase [Motilibacteraceae bacterium]
MNVRVTVLGTFEVTVDGVPVPTEAWGRRHAAALVKLLALSPGRRLHREQVMEALWPGVAPQSAGPRLHKAAHYARRALGDDPTAVVLRQDSVGLLPAADVWIDRDEFHRRGSEALASGGREAAEDVLPLYGGPLLPDDVYEPWTEAAREAARVLHLDLLRASGRWEQLLAEEPADEEAHLGLARASADRGDTRGALRQLERLEQALHRELGTAMSPEAQELRARLESRAPAAPDGSTGRRLFGRKEVGDRIRAAVEGAETGRGSTLVFAGPPGVGKSAVLDVAEAVAHRRGWRSGRGTASSVEGPWPYSPVLEALGDLCRHHPALLDGLDDTYRQEIERALSGRDMAWSGDSRHQRLFVATAELMRLAAAGHGLLLVVDDLQDADDASLRLLHYLSRCAMSEPVVLALAHRDQAAPAVQNVVDSMVSRGSGVRIDVAPLSTSVARRLVADRFPHLIAEEVEQVCAASGGLPFLLLELARRRSTDGSGAALPILPPDVLHTFQRVAILGTTFSTDELLAVSGAGEQDTYAHLEVALGTRLVQRCSCGYCFRHALVRESLLEQMPPQLAAEASHQVADQLAALGAPAARVAHQYLAAGLPSRAVPFVVRAVETAGALGAYRDALSLIEQVVQHAGPEDLPRLLARRGDLLMALGDPEAIPAYREALAVTTGTDHRLMRARLGRAASLAGDLDTARAALTGLDPEGDAADAPILLAQGHLAYFTGDLDTAWRVADLAREQLREPDDQWFVVDLVGLQGLIAHHRGEWFERFHVELTRAHGKQ